MRLIPSLTYNDVFDDFDEVNVDDLLKDIPTLKGLKLVADIGARIYMQELGAKVQNLYYDILLTILPESSAFKLENFLEDYFNKNKVNILIVSELYNLTLIDYLITHHNDLENEDLNPDLQLNLFKAYLYLGEKALASNNYKSFPEVLNDEELAREIIKRQLPNAEIFIRKNFNTQTSKAKIFFDFCTTNNSFKGYLNEFLKYRQVSKWQTYIGSLLLVYLQYTGISSESAVSTLMIPDGETTRTVRDLLDSITLKIDHCEHKPDFLNIRNNPIVKLANDEYMVLNFNFFIDKLFQAIQFDFAHIVSLLKLEYKGRIIDNYLDFKRRVYAPEFSEKGLFYSVMNKFTEKRRLNYKATGELLKVKLKNSEPDFYYRDKSKVFFFEFKDTYVSAESKYSRDFSKIYLELEEKLISKEEITGKKKIKLYTS